jgi:pyruvate dehydrogenase E1 component alpha subunit
MHLYAKEYLTASSGIVGAAGPTAIGFALSAQYLRPGAIAVAFFGEGAMNQGMLMESLNLASAWKLPVVFVCKDDDWAITTKPEGVTGGDLGERVRGLGIPVVKVDGLDAGEVWEAGHWAIDHARSDKGPAFLHARCVHLEGHFLGLQLLRVARNPLKEMPKVTLPLARPFLHPRGAALRERVAGLQIILAAALATLRDPRRDKANDPVWRMRQNLISDPARLQELEDQIESEINQVLASTLGEIPS